MSLQKQGKADYADYADKVVNTLFNPFEHNNILVPTNATPFKKGLYHSAGLAAGYGGLAFVLRRVIQAKEALGQKKDADRLRSYVSARYPVISMDPSVEDVEKERSLKDLGVEPSEEYPEIPLVEKRAGAGDPIPTPGSTSGAQSGASQILSGVTAPISAGLHGDQHTTAIALALAGIAAGTTAGWRLADYMADRARKAELSKDIEDKNNEVQKLMYSEFNRTRGLDKAAKQTFEDWQNSQAAPPAGDPGVLSTIGSAVRHPTGVLRGGEAIAWVVAAASLALGYKASKMYMDRQDPARARLKELKEFARDKAKAKDAPILMELSDLPSPVGAIQAKPSKKPLSSVAMPARSKTETDPQDPYANLLTG